MAFSTLASRHMLTEAAHLNIRQQDLLPDFVDPARLERDAFWIEDAVFFEIIERAARMSGLPALGFHLGARCNAAVFGATGLLIAVVPTFRHAMQAMARYIQFARGGPDMFLSDRASELRIELGRLDAHISVRHCITETLLVFLHQIATQFAGSSRATSRILLDYPAPPHVAKYHEAFACKVLFDQPRSGMVVSHSTAERVQPTAQPALAERLRILVEQEFALGRSSDLVQQVRTQLRACAGSEPLGMVAVAHRLGMSERSLRRQLAAEGVDFRSISKESRQEVASQMLMAKGVSVKQVAHELGYRSSSAFHRAFKRWMGSSPSVYAIDARSDERPLAP